MPAKAGIQKVHCTLIHERYSAILNTNLSDPYAPFFLNFWHIWYIFDQKNNKGSMMSRHSPQTPEDRPLILLRDQTAPYRLVADALFEAVYALDDENPFFILH